MSRVSSDALISRPLDGGAQDGGRPRPMVRYRNPLRAIHAEVMLGGHGEAVTYRGSLIGERLRRQEERAEAPANLPTEDGLVAECADEAVVWFEALP